ncbi:ABC transporter permease [Micrococcus luteus]
MSTATVTDQTLRHERPGRARSSTRILAAFVRHDLLRQLRMWDAQLFIIGLPLGMFLLFNTLNGGSDDGAAFAYDGNLTAYLMVSMALYGAAVATTSLAGTAATERQLGWGRQLGMTALSPSLFVAGKAVIGGAVAVVPVVVVFVAGWFIGAEFASADRWAWAFLLTLAVALPFALYGLAAAMLFRSEAAVSAAAGGLVVFAFLGNLFTPINEMLLGVARFSPLYGPSLVARWPMMEGEVILTDAPPVTEPLWLALVNIGGWTAVFAMVCLLADRRRTRR